MVVVGGLRLSGCGSGGGAAGEGDGVGLVGGGVDCGRVGEFRVGEFEDQGVGAGRAAEGDWREVVAVMDCGVVFGVVGIGGEDLFLADEEVDGGLEEVGLVAELVERGWGVVGFGGVVWFRGGFALGFEGGDLGEGAVEVCLEFGAAV